MKNVLKASALVAAGMVLGIGLLFSFAYCLQYIDNWEESCGMSGYYPD